MSNNYLELVKVICDISVEKKNLQDQVNELKNELKAELEHSKSLQNEIAEFDNKIYELEQKVQELTWKNNYLKDNLSENFSDILQRFLDHIYNKNKLVIEPKNITL